MKTIRYLAAFTTCSAALLFSQTAQCQERNAGKHHKNPVATASKPKGRTYFGVRGQIVALVLPKNPDEKLAAVIDHEEIPGFMRAMRMTMPFQNAAQARKLKPGSKIRFDLVLQRGFAMANIKPLPPKTPLKLAKKAAMRM